MEFNEKNLSLIEDICRGANPDFTYPLSPDAVEALKTLTYGELLTMILAVAVERCENWEQVAHLIHDAGVALTQARGEIHRLDEYDEEQDEEAYV